MFDLNLECAACKYVIQYQDLFVFRITPTPIPTPLSVIYIIVFNSTVATSFSLRDCINKHIKIIHDMTNQQNECAPTEDSDQPE